MTPTMKRTGPVAAPGIARKRGEKNREDKLAGEILDAYNNTGASVKRKEDMHKMADANRAFSHYKF